MQVDRMTKYIENISDYTLPKHCITHHSLQHFSNTRRNMMQILHRYRC